MCRESLSLSPTASPTKTKFINKTIFFYKISFLGNLSYFSVDIGLYVKNHGWFAGRRSLGWERDWGYGWELELELGLGVGVMSRCLGRLLRSKP